MYGVSILLWLLTLQAWGISENSLLITFCSTIPVSVVAGFVAIFATEISGILFDDRFAGLVIIPILSLYLVVINLAGLAHILWVALERSGSFIA